MEDGYYKQVAEAVFSNIGDKISKSPLIAQTFSDRNSDETDVSAAAEVIDAIHLSELAAAMGGDYAVARFALNKLNENFEIYMASCRYIPQKEIYLETVSPILQHLDN